MSSTTKRTRNHPNLSDCHSCFTRINHTSNPNQRLQPLKSVWRIVLLCKKCIKSTSSAQSCTYCFKAIEINDDKIVNCRLCNCRIHSECVSLFKDSPPFSFMKVEGEGVFSSVCVDCWVPEGLKRAARGAVGVGMGAEGRLINSMKGRKRGGKGLGDKELASRFRSVFSEYLRIERKEFSLDVMDLNVWRILYWGGVSYKRRKDRKKVGSFGLESGVRGNGSGGNVELLTYKRDKKRKVFTVDDDDDGRADCSGDVVCVDGDKSGGSPVDGEGHTLEDLICVNDGIKVDRFGENLITYKRTRFRRKGQVDGMESGECRVCHNLECTCKTENQQPDVEKDATCEANEVLPNGSSKREATIKPCSSRLHAGNIGCENKATEFALSNSETDSISKCDDGLRLPDEGSDAGLDRYCVKYVKRAKGSTSGLNAEMKPHSDSIQHQSEAPATGIIVHHNAEPGTKSNLKT